MFGNKTAELSLITL